MELFKYSPKLLLHVISVTAYGRSKVGLYPKPGIVRNSYFSKS
jgi:hypothetical protein